jgi:hypothetical protein
MLPVALHIRVVVLSLLASIHSMVSRGQGSLLGSSSDGSSNINLSHAELMFAGNAQQADSCVDCCALVSMQGHLAARQLAGATVAPCCVVVCLHCINCSTLY